MKKRPTHATPAGRTFLALQKKARAEGKPTDELPQGHVLEAFVDRLSTSPYASSIALKGGVLLSAYAARRPTRDVDLFAIGIANDTESVERVVTEIAALPADDGWELAVNGTEPIREDAAFSGVRVTLTGSLASAEQHFHVDMNFGDPVVPAPSLVSLERLLGGQITLRGYSLSMVFAEKLVTAVQLGTANTRWRDYVDVYLLSRLHQLDGDTFAASLAEVITARGATRRKLSDATAGYAELAQSRWSQWCRRQRLEARVPAHFDDVLRHVYTFADPALADEISGRVWLADVTQWS